ncbi:proline-rich receptor-like protein kinase PERK12 [Iris pallida]|uniref:Proline-rich receptor-like protein kinase PERK12 n=1 Tax=Iris pallida TaxID=29817 RepID=A0AAX6FK46_IRIPA|nr:proline-rich receptor-like protein kinase PERK12 [Iris pallida]
MIFEKSDRWIDDFFAPSQSRFAGPTSSACISSTAAPFGVLLVLVRSWYNPLPAPFRFHFSLSLFDWLNSTPKLAVRIRNFQLVKFHF